MSILLDLSNKALTMAASFTNKSIVVGKKRVPKSTKTPKLVIKAQRALTKAKHRSSPSLKLAKAEYRKTVRRARVRICNERDQKLDQILNDNPSSAFAFIDSCRKSAPVALMKLTVADGFYDSMSSIKSCSLSDLMDDPVIKEQLDTYKHISKLCQDKHTIPPVSMEKSSDILKRIKKNVCDIFSITALHYLNAGDEGLIHFNFLLNGIIEDVNNASLDELNLALGLILFKGHGKEKTSDRSYRTISSCPFTAKSLDLYLHDLFHERWDLLQAETQYQGTGSNHELAALLVTEVIQHSLHVSNQPVFMLTVDAQSASTAV